MLAPAYSALGRCGIGRLVRPVTRAIVGTAGVDRGAWSRCALTTASSLSGVTAHPLGG